MTAERRALLGDHEASKRLSEAGGAAAMSYVQRKGKGAERTLLSAKCPQKCDLHEMFYKQRMV